MVCFDFRNETDFRKSFNKNFKYQNGQKFLNTQVSLAPHLFVSFKITMAKIFLGILKLWIIYFMQSPGIKFESAYRFQISAGSQILGPLLTLENHGKAGNRTMNYCPKFLSDFDGPHV